MSSAICDNVRIPTPKPPKTLDECRLEKQTENLENSKAILDLSKFKLQQTAAELKSNRIKNVPAPEQLSNDRRRPAENKNNQKPKKCDAENDELEIPQQSNDEETLSMKEIKDDKVRAQAAARSRQKKEEAAKEQLRVLQKMKQHNGKLREEIRNLSDENQSYKEKINQLEARIKSLDAEYKAKNANLTEHLNIRKEIIEDQNLVIELLRKRSGIIQMKSALTQTDVSADSIIASYCSNYSNRNIIKLAGNSSNVKAENKAAIPTTLTPSAVQQVLINVVPTGLNPTKINGNSRIFTGATPIATSTVVEAKQHPSGIILPSTSGCPPYKSVIGNHAPEKLLPAHAPTTTITTAADNNQVFPNDPLGFLRASRPKAINSSRRRTASLMARIDHQYLINLQQQKFCDNGLASEPVIKKSKDSSGIIRLIEKNENFLQSKMNPLSLKRCVV
uniref:BZIP domain-containing protein n=1 Tax=Syphacia muris TaxID=451379 RepID=A0A158R5C6_9BILA